MRCHYDVLNVAKDAPLDEIKKSYKKLAIKWHPDKNLDNTEAATEQFQLLQQAFEVLSDPHERSWYDDHREAILKGKVGGDHEDDSLDVYQYFTASCYKGFGNDEKGFYSVYREVFNKISAEDSEYYEEGDSDIEIPSFGNNDSGAEEVKEFYAYWQSYCTKRSFSWLDPYDTRQAENRRVSRLIEKENKKIRDKAKKARNDEVRELVNFVRKRDKRIQVHAQQQKELNAEKAKKAEEKRREKIKERKEQLTKHKESEWSKFSNLENELKNIEADLAVEFGESISDVNSEDEIIDDQLYCVACNKLFKTSRAFENHESSKRHKENVEILKTNMLEGSGTEDESSEGSNISDVNEGEDCVDDDDDELKEFSNDPLFCSVCAKKFKTLKAIEDHKKSKEHQIMDKAYKQVMSDVLGVDEDIDPSRNVFADLKKETCLFEPDVHDDVEGNCKYGSAAASQICQVVNELTKDNNKIKEEVNRFCKEVDEILDSDGSLDQFLKNLHDDDTKIKPLKSERKNLRQCATLVDSEEENDFLRDTKKKPKKPQKQKFQYNKSKYNNNDSLLIKSDDNGTTNTDNGTETNSVSQDSIVTSDTSSSKERNQGKLSSSKKKQTRKKNYDPDTDTTCVVCSSTFSSKNKLFLHLSSTGHSVYISDKSKSLNKVGEGDSDIGSKKKKNKRK